MKNKIFLFVALILCLFQSNSLLAEDALLAPELPTLPAVLPTVPEMVVPLVEIAPFVVPSVTEESVEVKKEDLSEMMSFAVSNTGSTSDSVSEVASTTRLIIKKNSEIIFDQNIEIIDESISFKASGEDKTISRNTVLGAILYADSVSADFAFTDIDYSSSYDSYLINCLNVPSIQNSDLCYDWQYVVNNEYPLFGVDDYVLSNGDVVYFYFGKSKKLSFPDFVQVNSEFYAIAESYDYVNNAWNKIVGQVIGVIKTEGWSFTEIATSTTDVNGEARFTLNQDGGYDIGYQNKSDWGDYYYPSYSLTFGTTTEVSTSTATSTTATTTNNSSGGSVSVKKTFSIEKAIEFLKSPAQQKTNGSFGADLYTDWAAVAFGAAEESNSSLKNYLKTDSIGSELTDILRRSMALMSMGANPQTEYKEDLIKKILSEYKNEQFGDVDLFNDDIFAVLVLSNFKFDYSDERIKNSIDFILENQSGDGSWGGVDITSAAIQALENYSSKGNVGSSISKARNYLASEKQSDGSWNENIYSTAWAMMGVNSVDEKTFEYLGKEQNQDGGMLEGDSSDNRIWSTSYAISGASLKNWNEILEDFNYQDNSVADTDTSNDGKINESVATTSPVISTTTAVVDIDNESGRLPMPQTLDLLSQNSNIEKENRVVDVKLDEMTEENPKEIELGASAINSTTKINYWYLAGGLLFALIALRIFRK